MTAQEHLAIEKELWEKSESMANVIRTHLFSIYMMREKLGRTSSEELAKCYKETIEVTEKEINKLIPQ